MITGRERTGKVMRENPSERDIHESKEQGDGVCERETNRGEELSRLSLCRERRDKSATGRERGVQLGE